MLNVNNFCDTICSYKDMFMYKIYLTEEDQLHPSHFPAIALVTDGFNHGVINFLTTLNKGVGIDYDSSGCSFWNDLDEHDRLSYKKFDGILSYIDLGDEVVVSYKDMLYYICLVFDRFESDTKTKQEVSKLIEEYKKNYKEWL